MPPLPPLLDGERRRLMHGLVAVSVLHAGLAVCAALLVGLLVSVGAGRLALPALGVAVAVAGMGVTKYAERVLAERLGQDYVHELRGRLVGAALDGDGGPSLGITIARTTNDLTSVRSWVAQGIAPMVAAVPLVLGSVAVLTLLHWTLALATLVPLLGLGIVLALVSSRAYERARELRRRRGRLASRVTDTLQARDGIRAAGGAHRERQRIDQESRRVIDAAVARARTAGVLQASAVATAAAIAALVATAGRLAAVEPGAVASALTIAGVLASPLAETGRIVEFRQNFRAARRVIAPQVAAGAPRPAQRNVGRQVPTGRGTVQVRGIPATGSRDILCARAGDRIHLVAEDADQVSELMRRIASPSPDDGLEVVIDGWGHGRLDPRRRRELVGLAARAVPLERGTVARAVRYRRPDLERSEATAVMARVGLDAVVSRLDRGERTELRRGGRPLAPADCARVHLARAVLGDPPLLLLDRIDAELDTAGRTALRHVVEDFPGVVVFASDVPDRVAPDRRTVHLAATPASL